MFVTDLDIAEFESFKIEFEKKAKSFFSWSDENSLTLSISQVIIKAAEIDDL